MKKILLFIFILNLLYLPALADEIDMNLNDYVPSVENAFYGQKQITDEDFEKTMKKIEEKKNKKSWWQKRKKGESLYKEEPSKDTFFENMTAENILLCVPLNLITYDAVEIPSGHYEIKGYKKKNKVYLEFRQARSIVAKIEAKETENDYGEKAINFAKLLPYDENYVKVIFGSIDFNAYAFIPIDNGISAQ